MSREIEELNWLKAEYNCNNPRHKRLVDFLYNTVTPILSADVGEALEYVDKLLYGQSGYEKRIPVKMLGDIIKQTLTAQAHELAELKDKIKRYILNEPMQSYEEHLALYKELKELMSDE